MRPTNKIGGTIGRSAVLALSLVVAGAQTARAQNSKFEFTNIDVPNSVASVGHAIASDGTVAGLYLDQLLVTHGFLRSPAGVFTNPIDIQNAAATLVLGIAPPADFVVGLYVDTSGNTHGFIMKVSNLAKFGLVDFPGSIFSIPLAINTSGEVVGFYFDTNGNQHGYSATANEANLTVGNFQPIDFRSGGVTAAATGTFGVNNNGDIVGAYIAPNSPQCHSFELSGGTFKALAVPGGGGDLALGINDSGDIAGQFGSACPGLVVNPAAFPGLTLRNPTIASLVGIQGYLLPQGGTFSTLTFPGAQSTQPIKINNSGMIVGLYDSPPGFTAHAFLAVPIP